MRLSVVVTVKDSASTVYDDIRLFESHISSLSLENYEIIIIGRQSEDNTFDILRSMKTDRIKPLLIKDTSYSSAINVGIRFSIFPHILVFDLKYPKDFINLALLEDSDIILASRYIDKKNLTFKQRWFDDSRLSLRQRLKLDQKDFSTHSMLIKKSVMQKIDVADKTDLWTLEFLHKANCLGIPVKELPIRFKFKDKETFDLAHIESLRQRMKSEGY